MEMLNKTTVAKSPLRKPGELGYVIGFPKLNDRIMDDSGRCEVVRGWVRKIGTIADKPAFEAMAKGTRGAYTVAECAGSIGEKQEASVFKAGTDKFGNTPTKLILIEWDRRSTNSKFSKYLLV